MRKLTPEERAAKYAHVHDENCGHLTIAEVATTADTADDHQWGAMWVPDEETPAEAVVSEEAPVESKSKKKKKAEEATVAEEA